MQTIHKITSIVTDRIDMSVQPFARLIHIDRDTRSPNQLAFWFIVNDQLPCEDTRTFHVVGTGQEIPPSTKQRHVGSVMMEPFIWHVFEETS